MTQMLLLSTNVSHTSQGPSGTGWELQLTSASISTKLQKHYDPHCTAASLWFSSLSGRDTRNYYFFTGKTSWLKNSKCTDILDLTVIRLWCKSTVWYQVDMAETFVKVYLDYSDDFKEPCLGRLTAYNSLTTNPLHWSSFHTMRMYFFISSIILHWQLQLASVPISTNKCLVFAKTWV